MNVIHGNKNTGKKTDTELEELHASLKVLGLPEESIKSQLTRFTKKEITEIPILGIIYNEFDFLLTHGYDLFEGLKFDWVGLDIKLKYLNLSHINKENLVYVIEGYRIFLAKQT